MDLALGVALASHVRETHTCVHVYCKIPRIRPPFDAQIFMPKLGGCLVHEDLTFGIKVKR